MYFTSLRKKDANSQKVPWFNFSLWFMFQRQCVSCNVWLLEVYHLIILFFLNWFFLPYRRRSTETFLLTLFFVFYLKWIVLPRASRMKMKVASSVQILAAVGSAEEIRHILSKGDLKSSDSQPENDFQERLSWSNKILY